MSLAVLMEKRVAARCQRDDHVASAEVADVIEGLDEVLAVMELLSHEPFRLAFVRRDQERLGLDATAERLSLAVERRLRAAPVELLDRLGVEALVHAARQGSGEDDAVRSARQVAELREQQVELLGLDVGAPLVDLRVRAAGGVDDGGRRARLLADPHEVVEDALARELRDDPRAGSPAREPRRDDGYIEPLERSRDVDSFPAGEREPGARPVALSGLEVRHRHRPIERRVHGHRDDQLNHPPMWWNVRPPNHFTRSATLGASRSSAATSAVRPISRPRSYTRSRPSTSPRRTGRSTRLGSTTRWTSGRPVRTARRSGRAATTGTGALP